MFVFLSKFLPPLVYPLGLACILILVALLLARRVAWQRAVLILALCFLWLGSNNWVAMSLARSLEWRYLPPEEVPEVEVIVLLGGGTFPAEWPRATVEVNGAGDRVLYTAFLYRQGKVKRVLVSGGLIDWVARPSTPAQDMAALLEMMGVPAQALWLQPDSRNTYEDALYSAQLLKDHGILRVLLVTSAGHMPRAVKLFQAQGIEVVPLPTDYTVTQAEWEQITEPDLRVQILNLLPNAENLAMTSRVLKEYIGILVYELRGWK
jgi:uncharacterized SAM-binding protein YcdF (DUF218 family)